MTDHQAARRAGEGPIGDECDRLAEPGTDDGGCDAEHLAHAGSAGGPLVAHDEHVARLRDTAADGVGARFFAVEHARRPLMEAPSGCELHEAAVGSEVAA